MTLIQQPGKPGKPQRQILCLGVKEKETTNIFMQTQKGSAIYRKQAESVQWQELGS